MTEKDYITITNLVKVIQAKVILKDVLPGFDDVISEKQWREIIKALKEWEIKLFEKTDRIMHPEDFPNE